MKVLVFLVFLFGVAKLAAQTAPAPGRSPDMIIELTTANENRLIGMLLITKDSSVSIYPGKPKEWKANKPYKPVSFYYTQIDKISLQKKNSRKNGMLIGSGIGVSLFAVSFLLKDHSTRTAAACFTLPLIPVGGITGVFLGGRKWKKFNIKSNLDFFTAFKNKKP